MLVLSLSSTWTLLLGSDRLTLLACSCPVLTPRWANFHVFTLTEEDEEASSPSQQQQHRRAQLEAESETEWACRVAEQGPRELGATVLMAAAALLGSFFGREAICRLLMRFRASKGLDPGDPALPFPSWEVQVTADSRPCQ